MTMTRRFIPLSMVFAVMYWGGCDTLKARSIAQDAVEKYRNGDIKGAADLFNQAAALEPRMPIIQINRGFTNLSLYQLNPKTAEGQQAASIAVDAFKKYMTLKVKPEQRQRARDYLLQTFSDAHKYDEAVDFFKPALAKNPPDIEAVTILGNIAKSMGKMAEAREWLKKRIAADPKDPDGYVALAVMDWEDLCADSQCRVAPDARKGALTMPPPQRIAIANHGIELTKKAAELAPNAPTPLTYWGLLLRERQYAYLPEVTDPKDKRFIAEQDRVNKLKEADINEANEKLKKVLEMQKAAGVVSGTTPKPGEPQKPEKK